MNEKLTGDNIENDEFIVDTEDIDFENLIIRLNQMSETISLLEKKYLDKL